MSFFYDLNARLAKLSAKQDAKQINEDAKVTAPKSRLAESLDVAEAGYSAKAGRAGKDLGKPGKNFSKIAKSAGKKYGSKVAGERVAGAVLNKLRHPTAEAAVPMTPKQKSFAKLAPPADKITFADKIAGAKQEVDEMLGDVAAEAMKKAVNKIADEGNAFTGKLNSTPKGSKFKLGNKEFKDTSSIEEQEMDEGYAEMDAWLKSREKEKGTGRFDKKKISTGTVYTRKPETFDDPETEPEATGGAPKRKGRPAGTKRAIGAKHSGRSKLARKDAIAEEDQEVCSECGQAIVYEKAPPGAKAERMVKHIKKSLSKDGKLSDKDKAIAYATTWKAHNAGKVEEESGDKPDYIDLDKDGDKKEPMIQAAKQAKSKKKEEVEETTTSSSVATAPATPKASKGMQFGKGVYESLDSKLENMIAEGMNVSVNVNTDAEGEAQKSITVTATGEDADKLAELLKMAGLQQTKEVCPGCGSTDCGCDAEMVDENSPDWPTNTETKAADPNLRTYSGGLNGPKSTGQTTVPVVASQLRRQVSMEENVELERTLFKTWKNYKG